MLSDFDKYKLTVSSVERALRKDFSDLFIFSFLFCRWAEEDSWRSRWCLIWAEQACWGWRRAAPPRAPPRSSTPSCRWPTPSIACGPRRSPRSQTPPAARPASRRPALSSSRKGWSWPCRPRGSLTAAAVGARHFSAETPVAARTRSTATHPTTA